MRPRSGGAGGKRGESARDTSLFESHAHRPGHLVVSDEGLREMSRTMNEPDVESRIKRPGSAFDIALDLGVMGVLHHPRRFDWPSVPDPKDWWMLDLALDSGADFIVTWDGHLLDADIPFDVEAVTPPGLLARIEA